jgi:tetratricopeptide (TPR) repeat protein
MNKKPFLILLLMMMLPVLLVSAQDRPDALKLYRAGNYDEAIEVCKQEIEENPGNMDAYSVLTWSLLRTSRYDEALTWAAKGMEEGRYDARMVEVMGEAHYYKGNNLQALKRFEEYANIAPTGMRIDSAYYYMGEIFIRLGEYNHADIALTTAVYHTDSIARWWTRLGYAREMAEDYRYALTAYNKALELNSRLSDAIRGKERVEAKLRG